MDQMISPSFVPGDLPHNASELCGLFLLESSSRVPVESFTITSDGYQQKFLVADGRYHATALFLHYQMARAGHHDFMLTPEMRADLIPYYGDDAVSHAASEHGALRALVGDDVHVSMVLKPGSHECLITSRPVREVIQNAWWHRELMSRGRNAFLRRAIDLFLMGSETGATPSDTGWPSEVWRTRALLLEQRLNGQLVPT